MLLDYFFCNELVNKDAPKSPLPCDEKNTGANNKNDNSETTSRSHESNKNNKDVCSDTLGGKHIEAMKVTKCPHKTRKHYAKVFHSLKLSVSCRICVQAATGRTGEVRKHGSVLTVREQCIRWECAKPATSLTTTR
jgi:hypothetical protein